MSYHRAVPQDVPLYPLPQQQPARLPALALSGGSSVQLYPLPAPKPWWKNKWLLAAAAVVVIALVLYWMERQRRAKIEKNSRRRVRRQSTAQMAKNLYERLEECGGVQEPTMRSLSRLARKA